MVLMPGMQAVFRPALFMYALIFACGVAMYRLNDRSMALLLFLPAVHTAFLSISIVAQDARYQLPLYAITLAAVPLPFRPQGDYPAARRCKPAFPPGMSWYKTANASGLAAGVVLSAAWLPASARFLSLATAPAVMVFILASVLSGWLMAAVLRRTHPIWSRVRIGARIGWITSCIFAGWLLTWMIPFDPAPATTLQVEIESLGKGPRIQGIGSLGPPHS